LANWDYLALAKAYGAHGYRAKNVTELNKVLNKIKDTETDKPTLVEVVIPRKDLAGQMKNLTPQVMNCNN
jgi:indolepyruvate decarboxylase